MFYLSGIHAFDFERVLLMELVENVNIYIIYTEMR
jgi:hypothetical protein